MFCAKCGKEIGDEAGFCPDCGQGADSTQTGEGRGKNPHAIGGFVCALVGLFLPVPVIDLVISAVGLVLCIIGVRKAPLKGLAVAGIVIGIIGVIGAAALLLTEPEFYQEAWD